MSSVADSSRSHPPSQQEPETQSKETFNPDEDSDEQPLADSKVGADTGKVAKTPKLPRAKSQAAPSGGESSKSSGARGDPILAGEEFTRAPGTEDAEEVDLEAGRANHHTKAKLRSKRPDEIEKRWKTMSQRVKLWWNLHGKPMTSGDEKFMKMHNEKIATLCEDIVGKSEGSQDTRAKEAELRRMRDQCEFPYKSLFAHITSLTAFLKRMEDLERGNFPDLGDDVSWEEYNQDMRKHQERLLDGVAAFTVQLNHWNIEPSAVISETAYSEFARLAAEPGMDQLWKKALAQLEEPIKGHQEVWNNAEPHMITASEAMREPYSPESGASVDTTLEQMGNYNQAIQEINQNDGFIKKNTHSLPLDQVENLRAAWEDGSKDEVALQLQELFKQLRHEQASRELMDSLRSHSKGKGKAEVKEEGQGGATAAGKNKGKDKGKGKVNLSYGSSSAAYDGPKKGAPNTMKVSNRPSTSSRTTPKELGLEEVLAMDFGPSQFIESTSYNDENTEFGRHVATRASLTGNSRHSRFIVDAGAGEFEYFRIIKGMDLGPGGAEILGEDEELRTEFNLRDRKARLKKDPGCLLVGACAMMAPSENRVARAGKQPRKPDTCIQLIWNKDTDNEPEEWPTRTDLHSLMGRKHGDNKYMKKLEADYLAKTAYIEACKRLSRHPETKVLLIEQDREDSPWLFPPSSLTSALEENGEQDEDSDSAPDSGDES